MQWKKDLYSLIDKYSLNIEIVTVLYKLPEFRNSIFLLDYAQFGYIPQETEVSKWNDIITINFGLVSVIANRILSITYSFNLKVPENGTFTDLIFILNEDKGWDNFIIIKNLVKNNFNENLKKDYFLTKSYKGSLEEKIISCLNEIKFNYDKYAKDIISGEKFDRNAWEDFRG